jgi:hypothetical protein
MDEPRAETDALFALVRARYGDRMTAEQLDELRKGVEVTAEAMRALRAVKLRNSDEPFPPFAPYRKDA